jgi:hypothetical protein
MRQRFASQPPPAVAFMGRFGFEASGCLAGTFLDGCGELHYACVVLHPSPNGAP